MATKTAHTAPAKRTAPKATTAPAKATTAPAAPRYTLGPWPAKAQGGNTIRAYCYTVASKLQAKHKDNGFTAAEFASALAANAKGSDFKQPASGWGTADKPNGAALSHANWFAHEKQGWLTPVATK